MMLLGRVARWLGIYLCCNLVTIAVLWVVLQIAAPHDDEYIVRASRVSMQDSFAGDIFRAAYRVKCDPPEHESNLRSVTCSVFTGDRLAAKTTYLYSRSEGSSVGYDNWDLSKQ